MMAKRAVEEACIEIARSLFSRSTTQASKFSLAVLGAKVSFGHVASALLREKQAQVLVPA